MGVGIHGRGSTSRVHADCGQVLGGGLAVSVGYMCEFIFPLICVFKTGFHDILTPAFF